MRPIFVLLMSIGLLFGMNWFLGLNPAGSGHSHRELQVIEAPGEYAVDLTISFDAGQDEFALDVSEDATSLLVQMNGKEVVRRSGEVYANESPIRVESIEGVTVGTNEFFVQAAPIDLASGANCVRVRILRDDAVVATETIWSEPGEIVQGTVRLEVSEE